MIKNEMRRYRISNYFEKEKTTMASLLEKTRKINRLLQRSENVEYDGISRVLSNVLGANVYITNKKGKIFGYAFVDDFECDLMVDKVINQGEFPKSYVNWLMRMDETNANLRSKTGMCAYEENTKCMFNGKNTTIVPIYGVGERIGTLIVAKYDEEFNDEDLLLCEYGATVVGMEMLRDHAEKIEIEARKKATVQIALNTLSFSERKAAIAILSALQDTEGLLVASKIADEVKITRSVIVNALRKFESAGVIESKSLGMKGTYIKVLNEYLLDEVQKMKE
jgi:transcriptional pleiotropic repressor